MKFASGNTGAALLLSGLLVLTAAGCKGDKSADTADSNSAGTTGGAMSQNPAPGANAAAAGSNAAASAGGAVKGAANGASDAGVTAKVKNAINLSKLIDHKTAKINVDTKDNMVVLRGTVVTAKEKQEAEKLAKLNAGTRKVVDQLTLGGKK